MDNFLADTDHPSQKKQLISLGAGSDTRFFRLMSRSPKPSLVYHELDFPENTAQKVAVYKRSPDLCELIGSSLALWPQTDSDICFDGDHYHLHPIDLRTLDPSHAVDFRALDPPRIHSPKFADIDPSLPTLLISECCLIYLDPTTADNAVKYFTQHLFSPRTMLGLIIYEPIRPQDPFGQMMVSNLRERGIVLQTLRKYGSLEAQAARMKAYGFQGSGGADVKQLWQNGVDEKEKERVAKLEMVDEVEEWELLAAHYCVVWGWRGEEGIWEGWKKMAK